MSVIIIPVSSEPARPTSFTSYYRFNSDLIEVTVHTTEKPRAEVVFERLRIQAGLVPTERPKGSIGFFQPLVLAGLIPPVIGLVVLMFGLMMDTAGVWNWQFVNKVYIPNVTLFFLIACPVIFALTLLVCIIDHYRVKRSR